jgi:2-keto-3-deoxy-L-rhamnonate aldolase RhmA
VIACGLNLKRRLRAGETTIGAWKRAPAGESRSARAWPSRRPSTTSASPGARFLIAAEDLTVLRVGLAEALRQNRASLSGG